MKEQADSPEKRFDLLKDSWSPSAHELPPVISPHGLSVKRQWYLYECQAYQSLVELQHLFPRTHMTMMLLHHQNVSVPVAHAEEKATTAVHALISKTALKTSYTDTNVTLTNKLKFTLTYTKEQGFLYHLLCHTQTLM